MRIAARIAALLLTLGGAIFALQGLRYLPSAVMYGRPEWVVIGGAMALAGIVIFAVTLRRANKPPDPPTH